MLEPKRYGGGRHTCEKCGATRYGTTIHRCETSLKHLLKQLKPNNMLHISIENIPDKVSNFSAEAIVKCQQLEADLNSGFAKAVEAYIPESTTVVEGAKAILETAIAALTALKAIADTDGLKGRLLTLSTQLTNMETEGKHEWSALVQWVQRTFDHLKKKG